MSSVVNKIKSIMASRDMSVRELGRLTNIPQTTINRYITNESLKIPLPKLEQIAHALGVTPAYLMGWEEQTTAPLPSNVRPITSKKFPMLGKIACGEPIYAEQDFETFIEASSEIKADFCLTAQGDSMIGAGIRDGDIVFVKDQPIVDNGQVAAVIIDDEATLKRWYYYPEKQKLVLNPENPKYEPLVYIGDELNTVRCLGRAVYYMSQIL